MNWTDMSGSAAVEVLGVSHRFGERTALDNLSLRVEPGQLYAVLGPNGGGKTTLFRLLTTLVPIQSGTGQVMGYDLMRQPDEVRRRLGVVFQYPSLDKKLTVSENLAQHAAIYGVSAADRRRRQADLLGALGIDDRAGELVERLSGGLRRRAEIAKALLHDPQVLLMDEPTTGLDPAVRAELWRYLAMVRRERELTVLVTTHLLEEAERVDRLAILDSGRLVAEGTPRELSQQVGGRSIRVRCDDPQRLARELGERLGVSARVTDGLVRWDTDRAEQQMVELLRDWGDQVRELAVGPATLEDVFLKRTGHEFVGGGP